MPVTQAPLDYDPFAAATIANPYPWYRRLRDEAPLYRQEALGFWVLSRYDDVLAGEASGPLDEEREGREMLYSSGTTGRPKGVRKPLPETPFGDPNAAPVQIAQGIGTEFTVEVLGHQ